MNDLINRQQTIDEVQRIGRIATLADGDSVIRASAVDYVLHNMPPAQPEELTDDDFETIRIHLNAYKEKLCNQWRWKEAEEYQRIIDRFMAFASAQPEAIPSEKSGRKKGKWINAYPDIESNPMFMYGICSVCGYKQAISDKLNFCPDCGADMRDENDEID